MTIDFMDVIASQGFSIVFGVFVMWFAAKYGKDFVLAWKDFALAIQNLSHSVDDNTAVTQKQYEESMSVKEQLKTLNEKLNSRDIKFDKLSADYMEIKRLLDEIERKVSE